MNKVSPCLSASYFQTGFGAHG